jgi:hypothetical protein
LNVELTPQIGRIGRLLDIDMDAPLDLETCDLLADNSPLVAEDAARKRECVGTSAAGGQKSKEQDNSVPPSHGTTIAQLRGIASAVSLFR